jgi:Ca-activated chloride channel family protein
MTINKNNPMNLKLTARRPALLAGFDNTLDVLLQVQGADAPPSGKPRTPLNLSIVLDRSGSMDGIPLAEAVRCARWVIQRLHTEDRAGIVIYDNRVHVLVSNRVLHDKDVFLNALDGVHSGGNTDLHGGWLKGADELAGHVKPDNLSRVLLLSDGNANEGLTDPAVISAQCRQLASTGGVTTSTYGLGCHFNEDLMVQMAEAGRGNSYYGETAEDLMEAFQREFDLLEALCAKQIKLRFEPGDGIEASVLNLYPMDGKLSLLPDLCYGSEVWAVIRLKIPAGKTGKGDGEICPLLNMDINAVGMEGQPLAQESVKLQLPSLVNQAWHTVSENELVARRVGELEAAELQTKARQAAQQHDWPTVKRILREAKSRAADNPWVAAIVSTMEALAEQEDSAVFAKEARYASLRMGSRMCSSAPEPIAYDQAAEEKQPSFLRRKQKQGKADS